MSDLACAGTPEIESGGLTFLPSHVYMDGMGLWSLKAELVSFMVEVGRGWLIRLPASMMAITMAAPIRTRFVFFILLLRRSYEQRDGQRSS